MSTNADLTSSFRAPHNLEVTPLQVSRVALIGQCLIQPLIAMIQDTLSPGTEVEFILFNNVAELPTLERPAEEYDFLLIALPARLFLPETYYMRTPYADTATAVAMFEFGCNLLDLVLDTMMKWSAQYGVPTFVCNFLVSQQNGNGRLMPRYDLRNPMHATEKLNEHLAKRLATYRNAYLLDVDSIASSLGRRHVQDDALWLTSHGAVLWDYDFFTDISRLEPPIDPPSVVFQLKDRQYYADIWHELCASLRTIRQMDTVKMVITDLDDTLWRGVPAEQEDLSIQDAEGWPGGIVEALMLLKRRGVILAIASKNEETAVQRSFDALYAGRAHLSDFAITKINWKPKEENIAEILDESNLMARNVVFIDDNPVERCAVAAAFPDMRILGSDWYAVRRDLLWSAETQVVSITDESERRGEMIQAQVQRETSRKVMSRSDFLESLGLNMEIFPVEYQDARFTRSFELLNKTNQFNTTGKRWRDDEMKRALEGGMRMIGFSVSDKFTRYGSVGLLLIKADTILQFVMSCRVVGLGVEQAAIRVVSDHIRDTGVSEVLAVFTETNSNSPSRDLYSKLGFTRSEGVWRAAFDDIAAVPVYIRYASGLTRLLAPESA